MCWGFFVCFFVLSIWLSKQKVIICKSRVSLGSGNLLSDEPSNRFLWRSPLNSTAWKYSNCSTQRRIVGKECQPHNSTMFTEIKKVPSWTAPHCLSVSFCPSPAHLSAACLFVLSVCVIAMHRSQSQRTLPYLQLNLPPLNTEIIVHYF